ncbi:MAG: DUF1294 domain-containing protein [Tractidigestivibacter sp.]|jgi:uncharacterized membrane protein YsdA (DUF1294 family)|uniref:DUF1294 domain-containing protein n=1 Tax=Tractidigestivibacter sp. TaxID=2847320 RepID=UPI003D8F3E16
MDKLELYLLFINLLTFALFTIDYLHWNRTGKELFNHATLGLFAVAGGGVGMLAAFLVWDRKVVKDNVAWRFIAILSIIVWCFVVAFYYGYLTFDVNQLFTGIDPGFLRGLGIYLLVINVITFAVFVYDKRQALRNGWRVREFVLLGLSLLGGALGGLIAMRVAHHKTRVYYFVIGLPLMIVIHVASFIALHAAGVF